MDWDALAKSMNENQGVAGWAQAVGAVLAILFSSLFAVFAPLYLRDVEGRTTADRAIKNMILSCDLILDLSEMLRATHERGAAAAGTSVLVGTQVASIRGLLGEAPRSALGPTAILVTHALYANLFVIESAFAALEQGDRLASQIHISHEELRTDTAARREQAEGLRPMKYSGIWHADAERRRRWGRAV